MNLLAQVTDKVVSSIFGSQEYCNTCYRSEYHLRVFRKVRLESCKNCHVAFKCQECQAWNHSDQTCEFYQLFSSEEPFAIDLFNETGDVITKSPVPEPSKSSTEMASLGGWFNYFKKLHGRQEIAAVIEPNNFGFDPSLMPGISGKSSKEIERIALNYWAGLRAPTGAGSISMTIANALYTGLPDLRERKSLLIHIVGAASREYGAMMMFEEILHLFPDLRTLKTVLVGPQTPKNTGPDGKGESHGFVDHDCCPQCTAQGRQRFVATYRGMYHDFAKIEQYAKPDLAVLFHSGRTQCEVESPAPTIRYLVDNDIVVVCTTCTKREAVEEVVQLNRDLGAKMIRRIEENKWESLVPLLETGDGAEHSVYYGDDYWYMVRGKA